MKIKPIHVFINMKCDSDEETSIEEASDEEIKIDPGV